MVMALVRKSGLALVMASVKQSAELGAMLAVVLVPRWAVPAAKALVVVLRRHQCRRLPIRHETIHRLF